MKYPLIALLIVEIISAVGCTNRRAEKAIIFNQNESVIPGQPFNLQGHALDSTSQLWYCVIDDYIDKPTPKAQLDMISYYDKSITAILPEDGICKRGDLIALWVRNGDVLSDPVFLNRARISTVEFEEVQPNQKFRVFGRNLSTQNNNVQAFLENTVDGTLQALSIGKFETNVVELIAPNTITAGTKYRIQITNGAGGEWGKTYAEEFITGRDKGDDYFKIGTPWANDFNFYNNVYNIKTDHRLKLKAQGNGVANDRDAIQAAINLANAEGGGIVFFSEGTYCLKFSAGSGLTMRSRVVLQGEDSQKTVIQYGFGTAPAYIDPIGKDGWPDKTVDGVPFLWPSRTVLTGLSNLKVQNVDKSGEWRHSLKNMPPAVKHYKDNSYGYFAANCHFDLGPSWGLSWAFVDKMAIVDCHFDSKAQVTWPWLWHCDGVSNFVVRNNRVLYSAGRLGFNDSYNGIIENNHITRYGDLQTKKGESGGFNIDFAKDIVVMNNRLDVIGRDIEEKNQGETILSQGGNPSGQTVGKVSTATISSLTDASQNWGSLSVAAKGYRGDVNALLPTTCNAVAIISGKGWGQWRYIKNNDNTTIHLVDDWTVIPDSTSHYAVIRWSAEDWLVKGNTLEGNNRGIWFYCGGNDLVIADNTLVNSEGIYLRSDQRLEAGRYNLIWGAHVMGNKVVRTGGERPAHICMLLAVQPEQSIIGVGAISVDILRNSIETVYPNVASFVEGEGYWNASATKSPETIRNTTGIVGTIFHNNTVNNAKYGYRLNNGIKQTVIKNAEVRNAEEFIHQPQAASLDDIQTVVMP